MVCPESLVIVSQCSAGPCPGLARQTDSQLLSFAQGYDLVDGKPGKSVDTPAGPGDLQRVNVYSFSKPEVDAQIALGHKTSPTPYLVDLVVLSGHAASACPDSATIRFR